MKVLIIEDEAPASDRLSKLIKELDTSIEILGVIVSVKSAIQWFSKHTEPDLVFLDIQLADGNLPRTEVEAGLADLTGRKGAVC